MNRTGLWALAFALFLTTLGCDKGASSSSSAGTADKKVAEAKEKMKEAVDATVAAAQAKRDEYARDMHKQLDELDAKYDELKDRAAKAQGDMKIELDRKLAEAKVKRDAAAAKLDELKSASADRWEKIKDGVGNAIVDLKKAFE